MSNIEEIRKDADYLHPEGKPTPTPPKNFKEKESLEKAKEDAELVENLKVDKTDNK